ncbi:unnamed protein product [Absidia cylindrospora]
MRFQLISLLAVGLVMSVSAVPELEHDLAEVDMRDCKSYSTLTCLRECPRGYVGVLRSLCSAAEDAHECCAVQCCRSRHTDDDQDSDEMENGNAQNYYAQNSPQGASGNRHVARSLSGSLK